MSCIHPLFDSKLEEVSPIMLAESLGFLVHSEEFYFEDDVLEALWNSDNDAFYRHWKPDCPDGYQLGGKYESEDGPYAFFVKPETLFSIVLWKWAHEPQIFN